MGFLQGFNWFDLVLVLVVLLLGIKGFINGLVREVFGLVGLIGGIIIASRFNTEAGSLISEHIYKFEKSVMADAVGFVALFIGFWLLCLFVGAFIRRLVGLSGLGFVDRVGGFISGGAKVFLILSALLAVLMRMNFIAEVIKPAIGNSTSYTLLLNTGAWVLNLDVNEINKKLNEQLDAVKKEPASKANMQTKDSNNMQEAHILESKIEQNDSVDQGDNTLQDSEQVKDPNAPQNSQNNNENRL